MDKLKIVALIGTPVHLNYFVNRVHQDHFISCVIKENTRKHLFAKIKEKGIFKTISAVYDILKNSRGRHHIHDRIFGDKWRELDPSLNVFEVADINSKEVKDQLRDLAPDVVIVQGTTMIKDEVLSGIPLVLNLHWGLSPYYRGSNCTEWAMINDDVFNIGFTIHKISSKIDGGDIVKQGRPTIESDDTSYSINMKLTQLGSAAMSIVLNHYKMEENVMGYPQQSKGRLYLTKHWTNKQVQELKHKEQNMDKLVRSSNAQLYPIVE